ncbi:hypothetical protein SLEP1_g22705 [Rubroshorea leprosula]|uniref:Uncharacterized protein n=1 Tax=Rubroshorea leprosula TaxID=152421 RepID=A0AAV5JJ78_9ROSI|nr:hypothetical protein SLEP1_g22705 [Rubroshorea leprosula]
MNFCDSSSSGEFYSPPTLSNLDLSPLKKVRVRSESDIERELEFFEDPDYIPPPTPCSESYETGEMSYEETLSIGGSEEVTMLEYSDVSVKGGLSGSEGTKGGVGRNEVVEVGAEEVPANILEVGNRNNKFYDSGADIVSEVKEYESELRSRDSLSYLVETYEISFRVLISDEEEEVEKLVRKEGDIVNIMFLTSSDVIEAADLYGPSSMSEAKMDKYLGAAGGVAIPKKPRKKSKTLENVASGKGDGNMEKGQISSTEVQTIEEVELRSKRKRDEMDQAQKKKRRMEDEVRGDEAVEFVPRPAPVELDPDLREIENKNFFATKNFINAYVPEVDRRKARDEALVHGGTLVVRHALEVNVLAQEFMEFMKEGNSLQKESDKLLKKNGDMKREPDIVVPAMTSLQEERDPLKTILSFEEKKRKMCEEENEAQKEEIRRMRESEVELKKNVQLLVHNGMKEHINNFVNSRRPTTSSSRSGAIPATSSSRIVRDFYFLIHIVRI